ALVGTRRPYYRNVYQVGRIVSQTPWTGHHERANDVAIARVQVPHCGWQIVDVRGFRGIVVSADSGGVNGIADEILRIGVARPAWAANDQTEAEQYCCFHDSPLTVDV